MGKYVSVLENNFITDLNIAFFLFGPFFVMLLMHFYRLIDKSSTC